MVGMPQNGPHQWSTPLKAPLKGIKEDFFNFFPDFEIDSILAILEVFAPFLGV